MEVEEKRELEDDDERRETNLHRHISYHHILSSADARSCVLLSSSTHLLVLCLWEEMPAKTYGR